MERCSSDQRIEVHWRPQRDHGVYVELYRHRRYDQSKRDCYCDREQQRNGDADLVAADDKYRRNAGNDTDRIPHLLRHQRECIKPIGRGQRCYDDQL